MRTEIYYYGKCQRCGRYISAPISVAIDEKQLPVICECGSDDITWDAMMVHHSIPKQKALRQKSRWLSKLEGLSPVDGFEICLLVFTVILLALVGSFIHYGVNSWTPLWKWTVIVSSVAFMLVVWLFERKLMQKITDNLIRKAMDEGRLQGQCLEKKGVPEKPQQEELDAK